MIRLCIFNLGGTIVDRYALTPLLSLKKVFDNKQIYLSNQTILKDMGIYKKDHIRSILNEPIILNQWIHQFKSNPTDTDVTNLNAEYNIIQSEYSKSITDILPETKPCIQFLNENNIKTGCTTEHNKEVMNIIINRLNTHNIYLDSYISSTCLNKPTRPYPYMIEQTMENLSIDKPSSIIKVDDTITGIEEGKHAGCWTVGVARWSPNMNITNIHDAYYLSYKDIKRNIIDSQRKFNDAKPDFIIQTLDELPGIINRLNYK